MPDEFKKNFNHARCLEMDPPVGTEHFSPAHADAIFLVTINALKTESEFAQFGPLSLPHVISFASLIDFGIG